MSVQPVSVRLYRRQSAVLSRCSGCATPRLVRLSVQCGRHLPALRCSRARQCCPVSGPARPCLGWRALTHSAGSRGRLRRQTPRHSAASLVHSAIWRQILPGEGRSWRRVSTSPHQISKACSEGLDHQLAAMCTLHGIASRTENRLDDPSRNLEMQRTQKTQPPTRFEAASTLCHLP